MISLSNKNFIQTSQDSNSFYQSRKTFRRLQRSPNRNLSRSLSRDTDTSMLTKFYVKNICKKQETSQQNKVTLQKILPQKKRQPTPCKSKKLIPTYQNSQINCQFIEKQRGYLLQKELMIKELQQKTIQKQCYIEKLRQQIQTKQNIIKKLSKNIQQIQDSCTRLQLYNKQAQIKIVNLQQAVLQSQKNLVSSNNTLQKLRKSINQNRINDYKKQNETYKKKIITLTSTIQQLTRQNTCKNQKIVQLQKQIKNYKNKLKIEQNVNYQSMKQVYLQGQIKRLQDLVHKQSSPLQREMLQIIKKSEEQEIKLKNENKKLLIQLDYIHRKHLQQIRLLCKTKTQQTTKYKNKYKQLKKQLAKKQNEWQQKSKLLTNTSNKKYLASIRASNSFIRVDNQKLNMQQNKKLSVSFQLSSDND